MNDSPWELSSLILSLSYAVFPQTQHFDCATEIFGEPVELTLLILLSATSGLLDFASSVPLFSETTWIAGEVTGEEVSDTSVDVFSDASTEGSSTWLWLWLLLLSSSSVSSIFISSVDNCCCGSLWTTIISSTESVCFFFLR